MGVQAAEAASPSTGRGQGRAAATRGTALALKPVWGHMPSRYHRRGLGLYAFRYVCDYLNFVNILPAAFGRHWRTAGRRRRSFTTMDNQDRQAIEGLFARLREVEGSVRARGVISGIDAGGFCGGDFAAVRARHRVVTGPVG